MEQATTKSIGDALEMSVEHIFKVANFKTSRNVKIAGYEIDVLAEVGDRNIIIECKNYQNSKFTVRNLLHQWKSKNDIIKANKVIIVIAGFTLQASDKELANDLDISLWDQDTLTELFNLSLKPDELKDRLIEDISFKPISISEQYHDKIEFLVMLPILSSFKLNDEVKYSRFNRWLRSFIITELNISPTTQEDRSWHISIFEGLKTHKGGLFGLSTVTKTSSEYWLAIRSALADISSESPEKKVLADKYTGYMNELEAKWESTINVLHNGDHLERLELLLLNRTYLATIRNESFTLSMKNKGIPAINCEIDDDGDYIVSIQGLDNRAADSLSWIFTSTWYLKRSEKTSVHFWIFNSLSETVEMLFRYFTEYCNYNEGDTLQDPTLVASKSNFSI